MTVDTCYSYNKEIGTTPEIILPTPDWLKEERPNGVPVDACMAPVIQLLWDNDVQTLGCCCGHGGAVSDFPDIILTQSEKNFEGIRRLISMIDDRHFNLLQWQLVKV